MTRASVGECATALDVLAKRCVTRLVMAGTPEGVPAVAVWIAPSARLGRPSAAPGAVAAAPAGRVREHGSRWPVVGAERSADPRQAVIDRGPGAQPPRDQPAHVRNLRPRPDQWSLSAHAHPPCVTRVDSALGQLVRRAVEGGEQRSHYFYGARVSAAEPRWGDGEDEHQRRRLRCARAAGSRPAPVRPVEEERCGPGECVAVTDHAAGGLDDEGSPALPSRCLP
jgi:hypothetical protein